MADDSMPSAARYLVRAADKLPCLLGYWDADLRCRYANPAYSVWLGIDPGAMIGRSFRDLLGDQLYALNKPYIEGALAGQAQTFERTVLGPDGVNRHSQTHYVPDVVDGVVVGFAVNVTEVTKLKERQAALQSVIELLEAEVDRRRHSEEDLSADQHRLAQSAARITSEKQQFENALQDVAKLVDTLKESIVDHIAVLDRQGVVTATNSAWRDFACLCGTDGCGSVPRSDVGRNYVVECRDVVGPISRDAVQAGDGIAAILNGQRDLYTLEYTCHGPGEKRWFYMSATRLQTSGSGAVIVHADITSGRRHRLRARESSFAKRLDH
jgi:PAS domain S-box-containing protein